MKYCKIILASSSPRRRELLKEIINSFTVVSPNADEVEKGRFPSKLVTGNAKLKAAAVNDDKALVIAADTVVYMNGEYYLKPRSVADAERILTELSGKTHYVYTGVCLRLGEKYHTFYEKSSVKFKKISAETVREYVATESPMDKAGAYGIQDDVVVEGYKGSYSNIIGLPLEKLRAELIKFGR